MSTNTKSPKRTEQGVTFGLHFSFLSSDRRRGEDSADSSISEPFWKTSVFKVLITTVIQYQCFGIRLKFKP